MRFSCRLVLSYSTRETANQKSLYGYAVSMKRFRPLPQAPENLNAQQSPVILELCSRRLRKTQGGREITWSSGVMSPFSISFNLKSVVEKPRFLDLLMWMVVLAIRIKLRASSNFSIVVYVPGALRWLKTISSTFQDVDFDESLLPLFIKF